LVVYIASLARTLFHVSLKSSAAPFATAHCQLLQTTVVVPTAPFIPAVL